MVLAEHIARKAVRLFEVTYNNTEHRPQDPKTATCIRQASSIAAVVDVCVFSITDLRGNFPYDHKQRETKKPKKRDKAKIKQG